MDRSLMDWPGRQKFHDGTGLGQSLRLFLKGGDRKVQNRSRTVVWIAGHPVVVMVVMIDWPMVGR
jgi:hypothetical protein